MKRLLLTILALAALTATAHAAPRPYAGAQFRYWEFSNGNDLRDYIAYVVPGPFHVQLEYWDFVRGEDQFRPEVGLHLRDSRRSVYDFEYRHEKNQERFTIGTGQILNDRVVGRASISPIIAEQGPTDVVVAVGADTYWGSYNFASVTIIRDPRGDDLWTMPLRVRLANESNDWFQVTAVPTTDQTFGWAVDFKYRWVRAGVERNNRYDFTTLDNFVTTIGLEMPWGPDPNQ